MRAIEFFAGIGGLKLATSDAFEVVHAYDQNEHALATHALNHGVPVRSCELSTISAGELAELDAEAWLLSPPCTPFTRRGRRRDVDDPRCRALLHLIDLMLELKPRRVLVENVRGFHGSRAHALLVSALRDLGQEPTSVEACPTDLGAPVRRPRQFVVSSAEPLGTRAPEPHVSRDIDGYLDVRSHAAPELLPSWPAAKTWTRPERTLPLGTFTRSYGRAATGAGPLLWREGSARLFSPEEILRLHGFPDTFRWPENLPLRVRWRLAGDSVHVPCVRWVASMLSSRREAA